jgi:hypothetical protein
MMICAAIEQLQLPLQQLLLRVPYRLDYTIV